MDMQNIKILADIDKPIITFIHVMPDQNELKSYTILTK